MFDHLIGQDNAKRKLGFYIDAYKETSLFPFFLFVGAAGNGKTEFARELNRHTTNADGEKRKFIEINSSTIKNCSQFFEQIYLPYILDSEVTIFLDEAHGLPRDLVFALLTIFNTENAENGHIKTFIFKDSSYVFDFKKQNFILATSESQLIFRPLKDRLVTIDFDSYNENELSQIFKKNVNENISFEDEALIYLSSTFRGNARNCIQRAKDVNFYAETKKIDRISLDDMKNVCHVLGILPQGLTTIEWRILNILRTEGRCSLQTLSAKTGLSPTALRRDHENYLLQRGFMDIDGQRVLTKRGADLIYATLKDVDKS